MAHVKPYLSVCAIFRDEADYLREWIEFHRLVGVERFFLYDNLSEDHFEEVLAPYIAEGTVVLETWPILPGLSRAYDHCLAEHGDASRWIAFIDLDEFLFSPTGRPVSELLTEYEGAPGVGANWAVFGTSGHRTQPAGLVIENYLHRRRDGAPRHQMIKSIVDPSRTERSMSPHHFRYRDGCAVDENKNPIDTPPRAKSKEVSFSLLRVNHYWTKSTTEWTRKLARQDAWLGTLRQNYERSALSDLERLEQSFNQQYDDTITAYAPALREALGMEPAGARVSG
jgi:hypothetical protein